MSGKEKNSNKKHSRKLITIVRIICIYGLPIFITAFTLWSDFQKSISAFIDCFRTPEKFSTYSPDYWVIGISVIFLVLYITGIILGKKEKEMQNELMNSLLGAIDFDVFNKAKISFGEAYKILHDLRKYEQDFSSGNYSEPQIQELEDALLAISRLTKDVVIAFFKIESNIKVGVNYMLYFSVSNEKDVVNKLLLNDRTTLGIRNTEQSNLVGGLYLAPKLNMPISDERATNRLTLPLYKGEAKVYNAEKYIHEDNVSLPGAPTAFFRGNDVIPHTKDEEIYMKVNQQTQKELATYFESNTPETRSLISLCTSGKYPDKDCIAVINIEASDSNTFKYLNEQDKRRFFSFYSIIYPTIKLTNEWLIHYKNYIKPTLLQ